MKFIDAVYTGFRSYVGNTAVFRNCFYDVQSDGYVRRARS
jgi:hypothetical protein